MTEVVILLELGQTNRAADRLVLARACLEQAAAIARSIDARSEQAAAHLLLSEVYEQLGDAGQALAHFKQHQAFKELVAGEKANQRLQVLQVAHDTELAQKEAEHLRSLNDRLEQQVAERTAELTATVAILQKEIAERQRAEAEIQQMVATLEQRVATRTDELATFFDMSLLAGQGSALVDVFEQALPRIMEVSHSRAICLHLLDAERTALRLAGQQNVPGDAQAALAGGAHCRRVSSVGCSSPMTPCSRPIWARRRCFPPLSACQAARPTSAPRSRSAAAPRAC